MKSNLNLLRDYGFALLNNSHNVVRFRWKLEEEESGDEKDEVPIWKLHLLERFSIGG